MSVRSLFSALAVSLVLVACNSNDTLDSQATSSLNSTSTSPSSPPNSSAPPSSGAPTTSSTPNPTQTSSPDRTYAQQVFDLTNQQRTANGLSDLASNAELDQSAQAYAEAMATQGFFSHSGPDGSTPGTRIAATGYQASTWGENIAYGYGTPAEVMNGWMNSAGHRANILGSGYKDLGVGYAVSSSGTAYWVQDFGAQ